MDFKLDPQLEHDTIWVKSLPLSELRLKKDTENPWVILVPRRQGIIEVTDLELRDRKILWEEVEGVVELLLKRFSPDKINLGALGNIVSQFHFHIIARYRNDRAWPDSIWGVKANSALDLEKLERWKREIM